MHENLQEFHVYANGKYFLIIIVIPESQKISHYKWEYKFLAWDSVFICQVKWDVVTQKSIYILTFIFFNSKNFSEDDFASALRKKQSASWALKWYEDFVIQQLHYLT